MSWFCPMCLGEMRPLFTGMFCPNDCDRAGGPAVERRVTVDDTIYLLVRSRLPKNWRNVFAHHIPGMVYPVSVGWSPGIFAYGGKALPIEPSLAPRLEVIITMISPNSGCVDKNRWGGNVLSEVPVIT